MSCIAVISPLSPTTYAEPPGRWSSRKSAVARAEVKMWSSGTSIPLPSRRALRSRRVKIELLVRSRYFKPLAFSASMNSAPPGIGSSSCTSTPSMSVSQVWTGRCSVMGPLSGSPVDSATRRRPGSAGIPGSPGIPSLLRCCNSREATGVASSCDRRGGCDAQHGEDAPNGRVRSPEIGPRDPDATPAGELADHRLPLLLPENHIYDALTLAEELDVLLPSVELEPHSMRRPGEVELGEEVTELGTELVLRGRRRNPAAIAHEERSRLADGLRAWIGQAQNEI